MAGRNSGKYLHPSWFSGQRGFRDRRTVADSGSSFRPQNSQQPFPLPYGMGFSTSFQPQKFQQEQKLDELKALLARHTSQVEGYAVFQWAKYQLAQGDDRFLNDALNHLRMRHTTQGSRPI
jgi:hypothetical protein